MALFCSRHHSWQRLCLLTLANLSIEPSSSGQGNHSCTIHAPNIWFNGPSLSIRVSAFFTREAQSSLHPWDYLEVGVGVGVRQPGRARIFLVLEGPIEGLRDGTQVENTHSGGSNAVPRSKKEESGGRLESPAVTDDLHRKQLLDASCPEALKHHKRVKWE